ncbi:MAG TPA: hypothetical protein VMW70_05755 [Burkholderiales bacterium]|nr:hypothetical protein [Burkholderiales bacterium]
MKYFADTQGFTGVSTIAIYFVGFGLLAALGVVGWQALNWMKTDEWQTLTVLAGLSSVGVEWATRPDSWLGIHNLLKHVPLSVAVFWTGMLPALLLMLLHNWTVQRRGN